jgi:hypothetical protein
MLLGNYSRAMDFLRLDERAEISRGILIDVLLAACLFFLRHVG